MPTATRVRKSIRSTEDEWTDFFCGSGGSSSGITRVKGAKVRLAANHWKLAVETHNTNHPDTEHQCADLSQVDPRRFPRTRFGWFSPSCTNHSGAKGVKRITGEQSLFEEYVPDEAADRSRATMWDVPRFAEFHGYEYIVVENVVEAAKWIMFPAWLQAMTLLGYDYQTVYLNSMHAHQGGAPAPQSRDRMYVVFWKRGNRKPNFAKWTRPTAYCTTCDETVTAMQGWKNPEKAWGRYRSQYVWRCPNVACRNSVVEPAILPAYTAIDWAIAGERIADRVRPLSAKTMKRIEHGLTRHAGGPVQLVAQGNTYDGATTGSNYFRVWPTDEPMPVQTTSKSTGIAYAEPALIEPFIAELRGGGSKSRPVSRPLATFAASGTHHGLVVPPGFLMRQNGTVGDLSWASTAFDDAMRTLTTKAQQAVVTLPWAGLYGYDNAHIRPVNQVMPTQTTVEGDALVHGTGTPSVEECYFRMLAPHEIQAGMAFSREYIVLGNQSEKVKQLGNAVTPPAARDLAAMVMEAANGAPVEFRDDMALIA